MKTCFLTCYAPSKDLGACCFNSACLYVHTCFVHLTPLPVFKVEAFNLQYICIFIKGVHIIRISTYILIFLKNYQLFNIIHFSQNLHICNGFLHLTTLGSFLLYRAFIYIPKVQHILTIFLFPLNFLWGHICVLQTQQIYE